MTEKIGATIAGVLIGCFIGLLILAGLGIADSCKREKWYRRVAQETHGMYVTNDEYVLTRSGKVIHYKETYDRE